MDQITQSSSLMEIVVVFLPGVLGALAGWLVSTMRLQREKALRTIDVEREKVNREKFFNNFANNAMVENRDLEDRVLALSIELEKQKLVAMQKQTEWEAERKAMSEKIRNLEDEVSALRIRNEKLEKIVKEIEEK